MDNWPILSIITFLPLAGVLSLLLIRGDERSIAQNSRYVALWVSSFTFLVSLPILIGFDSTLTGYHFEEKAVWLAGTGIGYHMGVDGISMPFVLLSTFLTPLAILASWQAITVRVREYMIAFLVLETMMVGMFVSLDMLMFYLFFEAVLIPMFLIIGIWGGPRRVYAAFKFFLYTLLGSVLMLVCMLAIYIDAGTTDIPVLAGHRFSESMQTWLFLGFLASFAVKVPMWPLHTWLPDAHVEAPTAGSMILAGVLLKMGGYGFLRFSLPMFPMASEYFAPLIFTLSIIAVIYTSLVALAQSDMKKMIAYSSVAHMGFVTIGIFTLTEQGIAGAMFQMISHGLVSAALFFCVGVVYDRLHTRDISAYGGVATVMPRYAVFFMFMMLASVGLPGTSGFVGEMLVLVGAWHVSSWVAFFTATGLVLGATYMLWLYRRVMFGAIVNDAVKNMEPMQMREFTIFLPLSFLVLLFGVYPMALLDVMAVSIQFVLDGLSANGLSVLAQN
ncbi:MAG: NADH-quinone oxidoreductase subunit M [Candidatus Puniceispirillum sp.]|nr:NADH-quinone oxidoreductase subunit M [Candidatus Puniceispirillum sp.]MBL6774310.1 NADH-quinone oxidoreductase subunit M [Candidatus Puniceispirillum sp.]